MASNKHSTPTEGASSYPSNAQTGMLEGHHHAPAAAGDAGFLAGAMTCAGVDFYRADGYRPDDSVGYLMRRIISLVGQGIEREMEPTGLTNAQWVPLLKLSMGLASTVAELARECDLDAGSMTRLLDRLEGKQLVRRVRSSDDRRVVNIELTDTGRTAAKEIPQILCRIQNAHLAGFSVDEWQALKGYLRRILDTAHTLQAPAAKSSELSPDKA
jgi:DNA-binding MarR family transcriptional regulator